MTTHELKCWPMFFEPVRSGKKTFEIRKDDREYGIGDVLYLREYDAVDQKYTGREIKTRVTFISYLDGLPGTAPGYVGMSIEPIED